MKKAPFTSHLTKLALLIALFCFVNNTTIAQGKFKVGIAGLNHDHIYGILNEYKKGNVNIVGIAEPNQQLWTKYQKLFNLPDSLFFADMKTMVTKRKPVIVLGYNAVANHVDIVELCAPLGIQVMVEKPLAATLTQAKRMEELANKYHIKVLTNYETTWHPSVHEAYNLISKDSIGGIRKMIAHDGHQGPRAIGCSEEFLSWLTDPALNGAGALNDFGCYGADMMTWLMKGQKPIAVYAIAKHYQPKVYPKVEDEADIVIEYPTATGYIEGSWDWPFSIKDLEVFGETGYLHAVDRDNLVMRRRENIKSIREVKPIPAPQNEAVPYFNAVLSKALSGDDDRSSLKYNMIVMEILDAAKRSINEGKRIVL
ncbi:MAG: Gfo/Idh/MocA family protein [Mucilaginibacter sp.]